MPADFVERWAALSDLADTLDDRAEELTSLAPAEQSVLPQ